ncbi:MAG: S8 family peptidase [Planctomycetaceae bacterium]
MSNRTVKTVEERMNLRTQRVLILVCVVFAFACQPLFAGKYRLRAKCRSEKRLSSELVLVRRAKSHYMGVCRDGRAVFEVPAGQEQAMRTMAASVDTEVPNNEVQSTRLLISYPNQDSKPSVETLSAARLNVVQDYKNGSFLIVEPQGAVTSGTVDTLMADHAVAYVAPDYIMSIPQLEAAGESRSSSTDPVPNDPFLNKLWGMKNSGATQVWPRTHESANVIVAVIDSGVDYRHPDLKGNMWSRGGQHGYDFYDNDTDPLDEENHGTHVAGTIAATGNNGVGVVGVTWKAQIMALRFLGPDGSGATSDAVKCIDWAVDNGAHILCNSWGGPDSSPALAEAVARAERKGVLFVAAAGNSGGTGNNNDSRPNYPASLRQANVISVGAIDENDARGSFSHYGKQSVDIGAPGVQILSTTRNNQYDTYSGTSMAAPHVAGAAALVWSNAFSTPTQTPTQMTKVRDLIYENARPVAALKELWGHAAPAWVPGGVLDITFLSRAPSDGTPPITEVPRRRLVENRMIVDPARLRSIAQ